MTLGTAVKIYARLSRVPDSVTITIKDPGSTKKVTQADMTAITDTFYSYIYQSASTDVEGIYSVIIEAIPLSGDSNTSVQIGTFQLDEQP